MDQTVETSESSELRGNLQKYIDYLQTTPQFKNSWRRICEEYIGYGNISEDRMKEIIEEENNKHPPSTIECPEKARSEPVQRF